MARFRCPSCGAAIDPLPFPAVTVDAIIETEPGHVLLVQRKYPPLGWALPGGFVDVGETLEDACAREVKEETGLVVTGLTQMRTYSDPSRDPRHHTVSTVFVARVADGTPRAADDAADLASFALDRLPPLAFDHGRILGDYRAWRARS